MMRLPGIAILASMTVTACSLPAFPPGGAGGTRSTGGTTVGSGGATGGTGGRTAGSGGTTAGTGGSTSTAGATATYMNSLTFGTGVGGTDFDLINPGTTFSVAAEGTTGAIYFKLESAADMAGRTVRLYINAGTYDTHDYPNPQSYGHILLSSFRITDTGSFTVKGYLVEQVGPDIGKETFVAGANITMQP